MPNEESTNEKKNLRRRILNASRHLLVHDGYQGLSMRRIGRAVGYSATSIYLHFDGKDALFHALIDEGFGDLYGRMEEVAAQYEGVPADRLHALCRGFIDFGLENPEYYEIMFMLHPERIERYPAEKYRQARRNLDLLMMTLAEGRAEGVFDVDDPRVSASTIWASLHGIVSLLIARRVDVHIDHDAFIETALQQTVAGVRAVGQPLRN